MVAVWCRMAIPFCRCAWKRRITLCLFLLAVAFSSVPAPRAWPCATSAVGVPAGRRLLRATRHTDTRPSAADAIDSTPQKRASVVHGAPVLVAQWAKRRAGSTRKWAARASLLRPPVSLRAIVDVRPFDELEMADNNSLAS